MAEGLALNKTFILLSLKFRECCGRGRKLCKNQKLLLNGCEMPSSKLNTTSAIKNSQQLRLPALSCHKMVLSPISHVQGKDLWESTLTAELLATVLGRWRVLSSGVLQLLSLSSSQQPQVTLTKLSS